MLLLFKFFWFKNLPAWTVQNTKLITSALFKLVSFEKKKTFLRLQYPFGLFWAILFKLTLFSKNPFLAAVWSYEANFPGFDPAAPHSLNFPTISPFLSIGKAGRPAPACPNQPKVGRAGAGQISKVGSTF